MVLIIIGIVLILAGGGSIVWGTMQNNDLEAQFTSLFKSGELNPGDLFILIGAFAIVLGIVLLVIGIVLRAKKSPPKMAAPAAPVTAPAAPVAAPAAPVAAPVAEPVVAAPTPVAEAAASVPAEAPAKSGTVCTVCGTPLEADSKFCSGCGASVNPYPEAEADVSAVPEITQTVEDVLRTANEQAQPCCPHYAGHNADGSSKCQFCSKANPPVPAVTGETRKITEPRPAASPVKPVYHAAPKGERKAICPHCGARQVEAPRCKYCGTPMM